MKQSPTISLNEKQVFHTHIFFMLFVRLFLGKRPHQPFSPKKTNIMGKRSSHDGSHETPEERKERKRLKKSSKSKQQQSQQLQDAVTSSNTTTNAGDVTTTTLTQESTATDVRVAAVTGPVLVPSSSSSSSSLYYKKKLQLSVSLLPCGLRNVIESIKDSIRRTLLLKYCNPITGILLAFDNVQIVMNSSSSSGRILEELPHIHYDVTCQALVFCPTIGLRLDGIVVESSFHSHLSLVVHGHFNASISSNQMRKSGFDYDENIGQWYHVSSQTYLQQQPDESKNNNTLGEDEDDENNEESVALPATRIQFTLHKLHEVGGIISMDGSDPKLLLC